MAIAARNRRAKNISEATLKALMEGARVFWGECTLVKTGERFDMVSRHNGKHSLLIDATDAERLTAHWKSFIATSEKWAA